MAEELKACPFCGAIPKTSHRPESEASGGGNVAFVVCYCGGYASTAHQMGHAETVQAAIAEVVEKWNTRAQPPSQGGEAVEVLTTWHPDSRSYEEQIVSHDTKGSRKALGAMNAKLRVKVGRERKTELNQADAMRDLLTRCQEHLDPHRDAALWSDVCAALGPKP